MLNAKLTKNTEKNGFELRLYQTVDEKVWDYMTNELGMNWFYSKTEKNQDGRRLTVLYRSYDLDKPQNIKGTGFGQKANLKTTPEQAYEILKKRVSKEVVMTKSKTDKKSEPAKATKTVKKTATKSKAKESKQIDLSKLTKAQLMEVIAKMQSAN